VCDCKDGYCLTQENRMVDCEESVTHHDDNCTSGDCDMQDHSDCKSGNCVTQNDIDHAQIQSKSDNSVDVYVWLKVAAYRILGWRGRLQPHPFSCNPE
jgi:hypothetical protein